MGVKRVALHKNPADSSRELSTHSSTCLEFDWVVSSEAALSHQVISLEGVEATCYWRDRLAITSLPT